MSKVLKRTWSATLRGSRPPRRDAEPGSYEAYVPDALVGRRITLDADVAADVADAETAVTRLNVDGNALVDFGALARALLLAEAVASSRIEGFVIEARHLFHSEALRSLPELPSDGTVREVLNNIDAMLLTLDRVHRGDRITVDLLLEIHGRLLSGTRLQDSGGTFRQQQNWIGGSEYSPRSAAFVPPPHEFVADLMMDLCEFSNDDAMPTVAQAAIAHAQFETIHPFVDGNGRIGRALIHMIFRRRGLAERVLPPASIVLGSLVRSYTEGLTAFRYVGSPTSRGAIDGLNLWVGRFAAACSSSVQHAMSYKATVAELEASWRMRLAPVRANSATDQILRVLPGAPVLTTDSAAKLLNRTFKPANEAIQRLVEASIMRQVTVGRRNRAFEAPEIIAAFSALASLSNMNEL